MLKEIIYLNLFFLFLFQAIPFYNNSDIATTSFTNYALRALFYDIPFFIIVTTIGLNIVTAVLIDRFSDLRGERVSGIQFFAEALTISAF